MEARLATGNTIDILAWTTFKLLEPVTASSSTPHVNDDTNPDDLHTQCFSLGQQCFDSFMRALKENSVTLSFDATQEAAPQES